MAASWTVLILVGILVLWFSQKAWSAQARSRKLAYASVALGLLAFLYLEANLGLRPTTNPQVFKMTGALRAIVGLAGIGLAIGGIVIRRRDKGTGLTLPISGGALSLTHSAVGVAFVYFASVASLADVTAAGSTAWQFRSPDYGFTLTLPSDYWKEAKSPDPSHFGFEEPMHSMHVGVKVVKQDRDGFKAAVKNLHKLAADTADASSKGESEGTTASGYPFAYIKALEKTDQGKTIFVGISYVWCEDKGIMVQVILEGMQRMTSEFGRESEMKLFEESANSICLSVGK
ncbi:MAG: hypothetical protein ACJ8FY_17945 [Gemmataceae bacterium]